LKIFILNRKTKILKTIAKQSYGIFCLSVAIHIEQISLCDDGLVIWRYRNCAKISTLLRTFLKRCKSACDRANVPPARICISEPRTGQVDIRDQQSAHSRVHSMSYRWRSARGGCDTDVRRAGLVVSPYVFRRVSNIQERRCEMCAGKAAAKLKWLQFTGATRPGHTRYIHLFHASF